MMMEVCSFPVDDSMVTVSSWLMFGWAKHLCVLWLTISIQWEFQDPKMEVLYHIRPYFGGVFPYIGLT